ncbi:MAG: signal recognition particle-docking protein FtsY [Bacteroidales bacterium]|nr:signal recognition particle-docking protein FtsY [Bacteroidales bacterium]
MGLFSRKNKIEERETLSRGLTKTKENFFAKLARSIVGKNTVDDDVLDSLEETLIGADVGVDTTLKIIASLQERIRRDRYISTAELNGILRAETAQLLHQAQGSLPASFSDPLSGKPYVVLVVGVNGVGKTTTIAKLAYQYKQAGRSVMLGAADTFRAAAVEQLQLWADRVGVPIVQQGMNADPASVAYDTLQSAISKQIDVVIIDTAGRLHNKIGLMNELGKIKKVMQKLMPDAPHEILLVLDASTGQNAIEQARQFTEATDVNALALTKLDGTAKGGVVLAVADRFNIPVRYIGLGEGMADLQLFNPDEFVDALFA